MRAMSKKRSKSKDTYVLVLPEKARSFKGRLINKIIRILREEPLLSEKEIISRLILKDEESKEYYKRTKSISYFRYIIWEMSKSKMILKAKIVGDNKHVYYFLPSQLEMLKDRIIQQPRA